MREATVFFAVPMPFFDFLGALAPSWRHLGSIWEGVGSIWEVSGAQFPTFLVGFFFGVGAILGSSLRAKLAP